MSTPTGLNMGWKPVTITPSGGTAITLTDVTDCSFGRMGEMVKFYGDTNPFPRLTVTRKKGRVVSITTGGIALAQSVPDDTPCTIVATFNDPLNGATTGGGALLYTVTNALLHTNGAKGQTQEFGLVTLQFECFSPTGTDPLTVAAV